MKSPQSDSGNIVIRTGLIVLAGVCLVTGLLFAELHRGESSSVVSIEDSSLYQVSGTLPLSGRKDRTAAEAASLNEGARIFREQCASCHGEDGSGNEDEYDEPLWGDLTVAELTRVISETMPEEDPDACVGEEAEIVAEYIYAEFYSRKAAEARGFVAPPRIQLQRLTVAQYRNSVADLIGSYLPVDGATADFSGSQRGLRGLYYQSDGMNKADAKKLERVDGEIDFDFGTGSPAEDISSEQFFVTWNGAIQAPHTGYYEFRVTSPNGLKLFVNVDPKGVHGKHRDDSSANLQEPLLDGWVSSSEMRELTGRMFLLGGRTYPLRLDFFKYKEELSSIRLEWRPPNGVWENLDSRHLVAESVPATLVVDTAFPADDRSAGYKRGTSVSRQWLDAVSQSAVLTADHVVQRLPLLAGRRYAGEEGRDSVKSFVTSFASRAWRRELTQDESSAFASLVTEAEDVDAAVRRAVVTVLNSPHFLYTNLPQESDSSPAARLAMTLWDSVPDKLLLEAVEQSRLDSAGQLRSQAVRMADDMRTRNKVREFFEHWLEMGQRDFAKDKLLYPEFDEAVIADLRTSLELFVDGVVWSESSDYRELLLADYLLLNPRLRGLYSGIEEGAPGRESGDSEESAFSEEFTAVGFADEGRAGVLTHPYLLSAFAYHNNSSPIHRGVFLTRNIMGRAIKAPPEAVAFEESEFAENLTMREKITQLTRGTACMSCHSVINPLGFVLEEFDAVGRHRTIENEQPVDTESDYTTEDGTTFTVRSARDVAVFAASSPAAHRVFVHQLFQHMTKQDLSAYGAGAEAELISSFVDNDFSIRKLLVEIALLAASDEHAGEHQTNTE